MSAPPPRPATARRRCRILSRPSRATPWRSGSCHHARKARSQEVKEGRTLVTQAAQPALTDLVYTVAQGAVSVVPAVINTLSGVLAKLLGG